MIDEKEKGNGEDNEDIIVELPEEKPEDKAEISDQRAKREGHQGRNGLWAGLRTESLLLERRCR